MKTKLNIREEAAAVWFGGGGSLNWEKGKDGSPITFFLLGLTL